MSRGEGAARLKMGLSFRTHSLNPQKQSLGGCEPPGDIVQSERTLSICPIIPFPPSLSPPVRLLSSPGGPTTAHCMHILVFP